MKIITENTTELMCQALEEGIKQNEENYKDCYVLNYPFYFDPVTKKSIKDVNPLVRNIKPIYDNFGDGTYIRYFEFENVKDNKIYWFVNSDSKYFLKYDRETYALISKLHILNSERNKFERNLYENYGLKIEPRYKFNFKTKNK